MDKDELAEEQLKKEKKDYEEAKRHCNNKNN